MSGLLPRERLRHEIRVRHLQVSARHPLSPNMVRLTFTGADLAGFTAPGPADHLKVFFPAADGTLAVPTVTATGISPPASGTVISRDYTPRAFRAQAGSYELDIDFVLHGRNGPASAWATHAKPGDEVAIAGPRGSKLPPGGIADAVLIADETALPAAARWLDTLATVRVQALLAASQDATRTYLTCGPDHVAQWFTGPSRHDDLAARVRQLTFSPQTFVFAAGEAGVMAGLRRYLRRELGLDPTQVSAHGYWKHGVVNLDHHAPLDPADPD